MTSDPRTSAVAAIPEIAATERLASSAGSDSPPEAAGRRLPVTVVSGFLGSGKTTLVNRILTETHGMRLGVLVNEFGEIGIDGALIERRATEVAELANGCLCCNAQGQLPQALARMAREGSNLDGLIVETSGLAEPLLVADLLMRNRFARELVLDGVITLVDCENFDDNLAHATVAYQQLVGADLLVLTKVELVGRETAELLRSRLATLNRRAGIVITDGSALPLGLLLGIGRAPNGQPADPPRRDAPDSHGGLDESVQSVSLDVERPLDQRRFSAWVESLAPDVFRAKGLVRFGSDPRPYVFHQVGVRQDLARAPQTASERLAHRGGLLVVFGVGLDKAALSAGLRACTTT